MKKLFVDSNIFIFVNIVEYPECPIAQSKIRDLIRNYTLLVNSIIISEVQYKLYKLLDMRESQKRTLKILNSEHVEYVHLTKETILQAVDSSYENNIRINDAMIAQHVIDLAADGLFTDNLKDFKKITNLNIVPLR